MTLIIMATERHRVFLSADFRLIRQDRRLDDLESGKLIPVFRFGWGALVAFSGLAQTTAVKTADWLLNVTRAIPMNAPFDQLPQTLSQASSWLHPSSRGDWRLTFSVVGFVARKPIALLVSNCEDMAGNRESRARPTMDISRRKPKKPAVFFGGSGADTARGESDRLKKLLQSNAHSQDIHKAMADINSIAAGDTVSVGCLTAHLLATGKAELMPHGISEDTEYVPKFALMGLFEPKATVGSDGKPRPRRLGGMTATIGRGSRRKRMLGVLAAWRNVQDPS